MMTRRSNQDSNGTVGNVLGNVALFGTLAGLLIVALILKQEVGQLTAYTHAFSLRLDKQMKVLTTQYCYEVIDGVRIMKCTEEQLDDLLGHQILPPHALAPKS